MRPWDFTMVKYQQLCHGIQRNGYQVVTIRDYLRAAKLRDSDRVVILRHDVDARPENALHMGRLERDLGLSATYYFRASTLNRKPDVIRTLNKWGHEIGYHYETLSTAKGDFELAIELFSQELADMRTLCPVDTISMHGKPMSRWDNRALWERYDFKEFGLLGECYLSIDYKHMAYLTDTGRTWGDTLANLRDRVSEHQDLSGIRSTDDLISALDAGRYDHWLVQSHPQRWARSMFEWPLYLAHDALTNVAKRIIGLIRGRAG